MHSPFENPAREEWCRWAIRLAEPVLTRLAAGRLRAEMPIAAHDPGSRGAFAQLEVVSRLLAGLAPWLDLPADESPEGISRARLAELARQGLSHAADMTSPEAFNFTVGGQPLVDAAFLAQAFLRAPRTLWHSLPAQTRRQLLDGLRSTRSITPCENNWWLFAAIIEAFFRTLGEPTDEHRLATALRKHEVWYKGDGVWGDGSEFHWDYYNGFVIQPMLIDILSVVGSDAAWQDYASRVEPRVARYAAVQERLISSDGSFPVLGRSMAYRAGALQVLAQAALRRRLPAGVPPGRARAALTRAQRRTLDAPGTFDPVHGWLRIGLCGHQPSLAENYISTASTYLCSMALLPLGLPAEDAFWTDPELPLTHDLAWGGQDLPADSALKQGGS